MSIEQKSKSADDIALSATVAYLRSEQEKLKLIVQASQGKLTKLSGMNVNLSNINSEAEAHNVLAVIQNSIKTAEAETECSDDGESMVMGAVKWIGNKLRSCGGHFHNDKHDKEILHKALADLGLEGKPEGLKNINKAQLAKELEKLGYNPEESKNIQHGLELAIAEQKLPAKQLNKNARVLA